VAHPQHPAPQPRALAHHHDPVELRKNIHIPLYPPLPTVAS
jgi:hypothetical protein